MTGEQTDLICPDCKSPMKLIPHGKFGSFYGCTSYPNCKGSHSACDEGSPKGIPANAETRKWRQKAIGVVNTSGIHLPSATIEECQDILEQADKLAGVEGQE